MDICQFEKNSSKVVKINRDNFENETNKNPKYIFPDKKGDNQYYAYCPECLNPIVLVNLFVTQDNNSRKAVYGKHSTENNPFASFDRNKYENCPLKSSNRVSFNKKSKHTDKEIANQIQNIIINNACKIKYFISKQIGIKISENLFFKYLNEFKNSQGFYYKGLTKANLPYLILYLSNQQNINMQYLNIENSNLNLTNIFEKSKFFKLENNQIILNNQNNFSRIYTVFKKHMYDDNHEQSFLYQIFEEKNNFRYRLFL